MESEEVFYLAALARCPGFGSRWLQKLLRCFRTPAAIWQASAEELVMTGRLSGRLSQKLAEFRRAEPALPEQLQHACEQAGIGLCSLAAADYPNILKEIFDPPMVLYYRGILQHDAVRVAMVGSRRFTPYGEGISLEFAERLAAADDYRFGECWWLKTPLAVYEAVGAWREWRHPRLPDASPPPAAVSGCH